MPRLCAAMGRSPARAVENARHRRALDKPYLTMNFAAEGTIVSELMKFAETGQLYRGAKPVMWSPVEKDRRGRGRDRI